MISIKIGSSERKLDSIDSDWINQQINNRRYQGKQVCVQIIINYENINVALKTKGCPKGQYVRRDVSKKEKEIFDLWNQMGLNNPDFQPNNLIDFLLKLHNYK
ncbi:MAG: hypothetical protein HND52_19795 [Ignavibacteriae bacterium]|nr:hypothetical protein [Ignavibacteriota bacterium]NOH00212.1 hypothetical protein [Ignavibacteriota bacterium]